MGKGVVFANSTEPQATTLIVFCSAKRRPEKLRLTNVPFRGRGARADFSSWRPATVPTRLCVVVVEGRAQRRSAASSRLADRPAPTRKLWENDALKVSAGAAIAYDRGQLCVDDRRCAPAQR
jgi:hypothetical protein